jgi:preprotein translocase subunit SecA
VKKEEEPPVDLHVNSEHEIEVTPNKVVMAKKEETKKAQEKEKENEIAKKDESTYTGLYQHIRERTEQKQRGDTGDSAANQTKKASGKVGRNDSCPCGSGRKYKTCHGQV